MSELGKVEERHDHDMDLYPSHVKPKRDWIQTDYRRNYGNSRLWRSEARSLKQEEAVHLIGQ